MQRLNNKTDEEVVLLVQQGNVDLYEEIIERYEKKLFGYLRNLVNQRNEEVEDLLQEVFLAAFVNLQSFETGKKFSSWIFRIAHNKAIDYFKKRRVKTSDMGENEDLWGDGKQLFEDIEIKKETEKEIVKTIETMPLKYKEVVLLYYYEEKNYEEISDILHMPTSNVGVMLFRAKKILKEKLVNFK